MFYSDPFVLGEVSCPVDFDSAMCWNQARANTTAVQQCPSHVNKFDSSGEFVPLLVACGSELLAVGKGYGNVTPTVELFHSLDIIHFHLLIIAVTAIHH